jgi:hypothetical protein
MPPFNLLYSKIPAFFAGEFFRIPNSNLIVSFQFDSRPDFYLLKISKVFRAKLDDTTENTNIG